MIMKVMFAHSKYYYFPTLSVLTLLLYVASAKKIDVIRDRAGDIFTNPLAKSKSDDDSSFCRGSKAVCHKYYPNPPNKCTHCLCVLTDSTFIEKKLACVENDVLRQGCYLRFPGALVIYVNIVDLSMSGSQEITLLNIALTDKKMKRCSFRSEEQMTADGYVTQTHNLFSLSGETSKHKFTMSWSQAPDAISQAKVYRINVTCDMESGQGPNKNRYSADHCLVIKGAGTMQVDYPDPPSSSSIIPSLSPSKTSSLTNIEPHTIIEGTPSIPAPTTEMIATSIPTLKTEVKETFTKTVAAPPVEQSRNLKTSASSRLPEASVTVANNEEQSSGGSGNKTVVYLSITLGILVVFIIVAAVVWFIVRSKKEAVKKLEVTVSSNNLDMDNMSENLYEGIIYGDGQFGVDRANKTKSGGFDNEIFDGGELYTSLGEFREEGPHYQGLITREMENNNITKDNQAVRESVYESADNIPIYFELTSAEAENVKQASKSADCRSHDKPIDCSSLEEERSVTYLTVLPDVMATVPGDEQL